MANLTSKLFGNQTPDVSGDDSRTQGDENLNALASSMALSMSGLTDTPCTKSGAQLNDTTEALQAETIQGVWTFNATVNLNGTTSAITFGAGTLQQITKVGTGDLLLNTDGSNIRLEPNGLQGLTLSPTGATLYQATTVDANLQSTGNISTTSGDVTALSGNMSALNMSASVQVSAPTVRGTSAVTSDAGVTATTFVSGDTWRVGNAASGTLEGSGKTHSIQVFEEDGTPLGYLRVYSSPF